jgi:formylglycine-generating enzyme required for sulfatase activity
MKKQITLLFAMSVAIMLNANNINITNIKVTGQNTTSGVNNAANYSLVQFDLSWENSWRTSSEPNNWDAAWVFVKYRITTANGGDNLWKHAWLNDNGHSGTGATIAAGLLNPGSAFNASTNPGIGVFIHRSADGTGTFSITGAQLRWNYGANGVSDNATVDVQVFAIEMVYVPQGAFTVGSGGTELGSFTNGSWVNGATVALSISSESELTIAHSSGNLWGTSSTDASTIGDPGSLPAAFPKGYAGFYCQKYEITQQQYVDFLNTLTRTQQYNRIATVLPAGITTVNNRYVMSLTTAISYRNGIRCNSTIPAYDPIPFYCDFNGNGTGGEAGDGLWIACNWLRWMDGAAYSDWAGLRPMTELEYEKASRGTLTPVANEYAWGNTTATAATNITNAGFSTETTNTSGANAVFNGQTYGPMRVGVFAKSATTRTQSGASYYGIMELNYNVYDRAVSVGLPTGRAFTGVHGNGALSTDGHANETAWPGLSGGEVINGDGSGSRGGSWDGSNLPTSNRTYAGTQNSGRNEWLGFRAVRRVP